MLIWKVGKINMQHRNEKEGNHAYSFMNWKQVHILGQESLDFNADNEHV